MMTSTAWLQRAGSGRALAAMVVAGVAALTPGHSVRAADADPVVARIDGQEIHRSDVMRAHESLPPHLRQVPLEMIFPALLEQMVGTRLIAAAGYKQGLQSDPEVKEKLRRAEEKAVQEVFLTRSVKSRVTEEALQARYKRYLAETPAEDEVRARHILVATEAEAKTLISQIKGGADFGKLAQEKSSDKSAAEQGGDLGYFTRDAMVAPFADAAFSAKAGTLVDTPVHTEFGWHVIRVEDRRHREPAKLDEVRAELEQELSQDAVGAVVEGLRAEAKIEQFKMDGSPLPPPGATPAPETAPAPTPAPAAPPAPVKH